MTSVTIIVFVKHQLAPVVQKVDSAIRRINLYPVESAIGFPITYPLDSDPVDRAIQRLSNRGQSTIYVSFLILPLFAFVFFFSPPSERLKQVMY